MVNPVRDSRKTLNPGGSYKRQHPSGQRSILTKKATIKYLPIALVLIGLGIGASLILFQSEEKKVKKQFHALSEGVSKEPGENIFTMDQKIKKIGSLFDETCEMSVPAYSISGKLTRDDITGYAAQGRLHFSQLTLKFYDFQIAFPEESIASVQLTARVTGKTKAGEAVNEAHELKCLLKKTEKKWLFSRIEVVEVLKK